MIQRLIKKKRGTKKLNYYLRALINLYTPLPLYKWRSKAHFRSLTITEKKRLLRRVKYYNKLNTIELHGDLSAIKELRMFSGSKTYYLDLAEYLRVFPQDNKVSFLFGDITKVPESPTIVKSRPVVEDNENSILFKLNKIRHYQFIEDNIPFEDKIAKAVWRGATYQAHRKVFVQKLYQHPLCDVGGYTKKDRSQVWEKNYLNIPEQLQYRYIFCIEGKDVATNIKWAMSSNSLCLMPKPKFETWFMEGLLVAGYHYVEIKEDYSDVEEKIAYYNNHVSEAKEIIAHANEWVEQFRDNYKEDIISYLVLRKYFKLSGQRYE